MSMSTIYFELKSMVVHCCSMGPDNTRVYPMSLLVLNVDWRRHSMSSSMDAIHFVFVLYATGIIDETIVPHN